MHLLLRNSRPAFTLIELILALALSAVLLALLASALSLGVSRAVGSRENVERARLVDGIISLVRGDVHRAVIYDPQDTSTAMELAETSAGFNVDSIDEIASAGGASSAGSGGAGTSSTSSDTTSAVSLRRPLGVYGTLQELQIDVLREHPQFEVDATGTVVASTSTSGITTIRYALGQGTLSLGAGASTSGHGIESGLVRQEVNRDLLNWATQTGNAQTLAGTPLLVAPEVTQLEFRYFDGMQLIDTWDSELLEGQMPQAIEMRIWLAEETDDDGQVVGRSESLPYVVVIALPGTWNATDADLVGTTTDDTTADETASSTGEER